jgi:hypothetical protein
MKRLSGRRIALAGGLIALFAYADPSRADEGWAPPPQVAPSDQAPAPRWYESFKYEAFVDVYAGVNYGFPKPQAPVAIAETAPGGNRFRAFDKANGASLHWVGLDVTHPADPVGGGLCLRFGPSAALFTAASIGGTDSSSGLQYVKNAYASWRPGGKDSPVTVTLGKFNQPFGSEVPESQYNMNYTRSLLYWYAQPFFMTGAKLEWAVSKEFSWSLFFVNGWNNTIDNNVGKTGATQVAFAPSEEVAITLGYAVGPEQADVVEHVCAAGALYNPATRACDPSAGQPPNGPPVDDNAANGRLRHFVDLIVDVKPTKKLRFLANADYGTEKLPPGTMANGQPVDRANWYGANLAVGYAFSDYFAGSIRGEYYREPEGWLTLTGRDTRVFDGTLTLAATPTPNLIFKLDNRVDVANEPFFQKRLADTSTTQITTTLGVVVTSGM